MNHKDRPAPNAPTVQIMSPSPDGPDCAVCVHSFMSITKEEKELYLHKTAKRRLNARIHGATYRWPYRIDVGYEREGIHITILAPLPRLGHVFPLKTLNTTLCEMQDIEETIVAEIFDHLES